LSCELEAAMADHYLGFLYNASAISSTNDKSPPSFGGQAFVLLTGQQQPVRSIPTT